MISLPEYGGSGELPLEAYGLTEADLENEPRDVEEAMDAAMQAEIDEAWRAYEQSQRD